MPGCKPRVVIPMHYHNAGITSSGAGLLSLEGWLKSRCDLPVKRLDGSVAVLDAATLPRSTEVWVLEPAPESLAAPQSERW